VPSLQIYGSVGPGLANDPEDVANVGSALVGLGLSGAQRATETGEWDSELHESVRTFQENKGLQVDGILRPHGPTQFAISQSIEDARRGPSPPWSLRSNPPAAPSTRDVRQMDRAAGLLAARHEAATRGANPGTDSRPHLLTDHRADGWWSGDVEQPVTRGQTRNSHVMHEVPSPPTALNYWSSTEKQDNALSVQDDPISAEQEREILTTRGYRYRPDPMGHIGGEIGSLRRAKSSILQKCGRSSAYSIPSS
jgi:hypothetical protein